MSIQPFRLQKTASSECVSASPSAPRWLPAFSATTQVKRRALKPLFAKLGQSGAKVNNLSPKEIACHCHKQKISPLFQEGLLCILNNLTELSPDFADFMDGEGFLVIKQKSQPLAINLRLSAEWINFYLFPAIAVHYPLADWPAREERCWIAQGWYTSCISRSRWQNPTQ